MAQTIFVLKEQLPPICAACEERKQCIAEGFGESCCDECDHLLDRFDMIRIDHEA